MKNITSIAINLWLNQWYYYHFESHAPPYSVTVNSIRSQRSRAQGAWGGGSPLNFSEEICFSGKNIFFFGQRNRSHQIDQSGKFVCDHGRKYHGLHCCSSLITISAQMSLGRYIISITNATLQNIRYNCVKTTIQSPMSCPSQRFVIAAFQEYLS